MFESESLLIAGALAILMGGGVYFGKDLRFVRRICYSQRVSIGQATAACVLTGVLLLVWGLLRI